MSSESAEPASRRRVVLREHVAKAVQHGRDQVYALFWQNVCERLADKEDRLAALLWSQASARLAMAAQYRDERTWKSAFDRAGELVNMAYGHSRNAAQYRQWASEGHVDGAV